MDILDFIQNNGQKTVPNPKYNTKDKKHIQSKTITVPDIEADNDAAVNMAIVDFNNQYSIDSKDNEKYRSYGLNYNPRENLDKELAKMQSNVAKTFNSLSQTVVSEIGLGTARGISDLIDMIINKGVGDNNDYTNPVSEKLKEWQDEFNNNVAPIYVDPDETWSNWGWYMSNIPSIMSSLTLLIPSTGVAKSLSYLGKLKGVSNVINGTRRALTFEKALTKADEIAKGTREATGLLDRINVATAGVRGAINSAEGLEKTNRFFEFGINGLTSRMLENYQEANQVYSDMIPQAKQTLDRMDDLDYQEYIKSHQKEFEGIDITNKTEVAKRIAKLSADEDFKDNMINVVFDVYQLYGLRNLKQFMNGNSRAAIRRAHLNSMKYAGKTAEEVEAIFSTRPWYKKAATKLDDIRYGLTHEFLAEASEGVEEAVNFIAQEEGMHYGKVLLNLEKDNSTFGERLRDYMAAPGLRESAFWGVIGGVTFQGLGSLAARAKRSIDVHNELKKIEDDKTREALAGNRHWFVQTAEISSRKADVNTRYAAYNQLVAKLKQIEEGKDPYRKKLGSEEQAEFETDADKNATRERVWSEYTNTLLLNSMFSGNYDLTKEYLASEDVKKALVDAGVVTQEEANKRQQEVAKAADALEASYDRNMRAIRNALKGKDDKKHINYGDVPYQYYQQIAAENMQHELLANRYQSYIDSYTKQIESEEARLDSESSPSSPVEENPLVHNGIHVKDAIRALVLSQQLSAIEAEIRAINKTEAEGRNPITADNRTVVGQNKLRLLELRKKVILKELSRDNTINPAALSLIAIRSAATAELNDDGTLRTNTTSEHFKKIDDIITEADRLSVLDNSDEANAKAQNNITTQLNSILAGTGLMFNTFDNVVESLNQYHVFEENMQALIGEKDSILSNLDKYSTELKTNYYDLYLNELEKNVELSKIAINRDDILLAAQAKHNFDLSNIVRASFVEAQNNTLKRIARDYNDEYDETVTGIPLEDLLAYAAYDDKYKDVLQQTLSSEDYKAYNDAIENLALAKPINSLLSDFVKDTIKASMLDDFVDVQNVEAGHIDEEGKRTDEVVEEEEKSESSTTNNRTSSEPKKPTPTTISSKKSKPNVAPKTSQKMNFSYGTKGRKGVDLFVDDNIEDEEENNANTEFVRIAPHDKKANFAEFIDIKEVPGSDNQVELLLKEELENEDTERDEADTIFTNRQLFDVKQPFSNGGKVISNPIITYDDNGNIVDVIKGIIANPEGVDGVAAETNNEEEGKGTTIPSTGEEAASTKPTGVAPEYNEESNDSEEGLSNEDYFNLRQTIQEEATEALAQASIDDVDFNIDDFLNDMLTAHKEDATEDELRQIIAESNKYITSMGNMLNVSIEEGNNLTQFIVNSTKLDKATTTDAQIAAEEALNKTFDKIIEDYAQRAFITEVDGKKVISLENLLRYCNAITGNEMFANILYDRFKEQLRLSDKYLLAESKKVLKNKSAILNRAKIINNSDNDITRKSRRIGVDWLLKNVDMSEAQQKEILDMFDALKPGDKLQYHTVKGGHVEITLNDKPLGRIQVPNLIGDKYIANHKGWVIDIPRSNDGTKSTLESLFIELITNSNNDDKLNKVFNILNKAIYAKTIIIDETTGKQVRNPIFKEIMQAVYDSGILNKSEYKDCINLDKGTDDYDLGKYLLNVYRYTKTKSDNFLADHALTRDEYEEANRENRINSIHTWFDKLYDSYSTAILLANDENLDIEVDYINQGGLIITDEPKPITEKGVIGTNYFGKLHVATASITEPGTVYLSNGERISASAYNPGSTMIAIPRNDGSYAMVHAFPVEIGASHLTGVCKTINKEVIDDFIRRLDKWNNDPESSVDNIFDFIEELTSTKFNKNGTNSHNGLFKGVKVTTNNAGFKQLEYTEDGKRKFIKFYRSKFDSKTGHSAVIQFPDEKAHSFKKKYERDAVVNRLKQILQNNLKYNIDFGYVKGDMNLVGVAKRTQKGKFVVQIPGGKKHTFNSYEDFVIKNGLVRVTTESRNGKTNFQGVFGNTSKESGTVTFKIVDNTTSSIEEMNTTKVVSRIMEDSKQLELTEDEAFYRNKLTNTLYARVTRVIQADDENVDANGDVHRFDPNSPWIVPSTNIGTGVDEFVRDFFLDKLNDLTEEELQNKYPNVTGHDWMSFKTQLEAFKDKLLNGEIVEGKKITIVSRDIKAIGEVEVKMPDGNVKALNVTGTLDLLGYDEDGKFYIFDMKTVHSKNYMSDTEKANKWSRQLQIYKQFLEDKYNIEVAGSYIIPIKVEYDNPTNNKRRRKTITTYEVRNPELKHDYDNPMRSQLMQNGTEFRDANPKLNTVLKMRTKKGSINYKNLDDVDKAFLDNNNGNDDVQENAGDKVVDILNNKIEGENVTDKIVELLLNGTQLNLLKSSRLLQRISNQNVIFAPTMVAVASYNAKEDVIRLSQSWVNRANEGINGREEAFRHYIHESVHRQIANLSKEDKTKLFSAIKEIFDSWREANKKDGLHETQDYLTKNDGTFDERLIKNGEVTNKGLEEFLVESITRPEVIKRLNEIAIDGKKINDKTFGNVKSKNLLQQILSVISKLFNIKLNKGSLLEKEYKLFKDVGLLTEGKTAHDVHDELLHNDPVPDPFKPVAPKSLNDVTSETTNIDDIPDDMIFSMKLDSKVSSLAQVRDSLLSHNRDNFENLIDNGIFELTC